MKNRCLQRAIRAARSGEGGMTLLEIMIVLAIIAVVMGFLIGPTVLQMFGESKVETAGIRAKQFYQACVRWQLNADEQCPASLQDISKYMNNKDLNDPWGQEYVMLCGEQAPEESGGFGVVSKGPDEKPDTQDDIKSWEQRKKQNK